jgi:nucleoside phosphorylase
MSNPSRTLVCFAVKEEARHFRELVDDRADISILLTGMGKHNAEKAVCSSLAEGGPDRLITAGFAGGLSPGLVAGTVVFSADQTTGLEPRLRAAGARPVRFHCADRVVTTAAQKRVLHSNTGAEVVEMESHFIELLCREHKVPIATVRVILDTAAEDLPLDFNLVMTPDQRIDSRRLALQLIRAPGKVRALLRLRKQTVSAAYRLGEVLDQVLRPVS